MEDFEPAYLIPSVFGTSILVLPNKFNVSIIIIVNIA